VTQAQPPRSRPPSHRRPPRAGFGRLLILLVVLMLVGLLWRSGAIGSLFGGSERGSATAATGASSASSPDGGRTSSRPAPTRPSASATRAGMDAAGVPTPAPINTAFPGLTTFRGNATRDYYGEGPLPTHPKVLWRYPRTGGMCLRSSNIDGTRVWCGTGWTGQPNVIPRKDGVVEIRFGAYDGHYHFLNGLTGEPVHDDLVTGDLAKGSATTDADGYPLYYAGSRDNFLRIVALDRAKPTVLWSFNSNSQPGKLWNDDWDGAPLQIGDYLLEGGENSWFYVIHLNRSYDARHRVQVSPKIVMAVPGFDQQELRDLGDHDVSIENSVAFDASRGVVYFANSGGLVQGWDISDLLKGGTHYRRVFRFWDGDETDASVVIDPQGYLYVGRHASFNVQTRPQTRDHQVGSLMKLDPTKPNDPVVWSVQIGDLNPDGGILGTPALYNGTVYVTNDRGGFAAVSQRTGKVFYEVSLPGPTWMSPVPIDEKLLVGDCDGVLHAYDISNPSKAPKELWRVQLEGCEESTPAVWHGMIWVGSRGGAMYGIGDPK
jgi:outer membrane protein assembly factor BamB